jgi:hypothetical protein
MCWADTSQPTVGARPGGNTQHMPAKTAATEMSQRHMQSLAPGMDDHMDGRRVQIVLHRVQPGIVERHVRFHSGSAHHRKNGAQTASRGTCWGQR